MNFRTLNLRECGNSGDAGRRRTPADSLSLTFILSLSFFRSHSLSLLFSHWILHCQVELVLEMCSHWKARITANDFDTPIRSHACVLCELGEAEKDKVNLFLHEGNGHLCFSFQRSISGAIGVHTELAHAHCCSLRESSRQLLSPTPSLLSLPPSCLLVGVCVILESSDGRILLTQRSERKSYGLHWVFPGGKWEEGERTANTAVREIREEVGIDLEANAASTTLLAVWESSFPYLISDGPPTSHYILLFYHTRLSFPSHSPALVLTLQHEEVHAAAWLSRTDLSGLLDGSVGSLSIDGLFSLGVGRERAQKVEIVRDLVGHGTRYASLRWMEQAA